MTDTMIELQGVEKRFGRKTVLCGVDLQVPHSQILAVIGPSGCGKSTLLKLLLGLIRPDRGTIRIDNQDINRLRDDRLAAVRRKIGMVFQSSALFDSLTVGENVAFGLREQKQISERDIQARVEECLEMVDLKGIKNLTPDELSGGMQKRVSLARALATRPPIILYDEPTTGLDPITSTAIEDLMNSLHKRLDITAIVVTHQMSTVYRTADRIVMLDEGRLIEGGTPDDVRHTSNQTLKQFVTGTLNGNNHRKE